MIQGMTVVVQYKLTFLGSESPPSSLEIYCFGGRGYCGENGALVAVKRSQDEVLKSHKEESTEMELRMSSFPSCQVQNKIKSQKRVANVYLEE